MAPGTYSGGTTVPTGTFDFTNGLYGWAFLGEDFPSPYTFSGGGSLMLLFDDAMTTSSVITQPIVSSQSGLELNNADVAGFTVYWGDQVAGSTVPEPSGIALAAVAFGVITLRRRRH